MEPFIKTTADIMFSVAKPRPQPAGYVSKPAEGMSRMWPSEAHFETSFFEVGSLEDGLFEDASFEISPCECVSFETQGIYSTA